MSKLEVREIGPISGETEVRLADGATAVGFGGDNMPTFSGSGGRAASPVGVWVKMEITCPDSNSPTRSTWDSGDNMDNSSHRFIAPEDGIYSFTFMVTYNTSAPGDRVFGQVRVNDEADNAWRVIAVAGGASQRLTASKTVLLDLIANDYVELWGQQETGDPIDARAPETYLAGFKLAGEL